MGNFSISGNCRYGGYVPDPYPQAVTGEAHSTNKMLGHPSEEHKTADPHWIAYLYGASGVIWGAHSLIMQQVTFWTGKRKKASKEAREFEEADRDPRDKGISLGRSHCPPVRCRCIGGEG